jgi:glycosyltransferase involved in cell wall biosynthesis
VRVLLIHNYYQQPGGEDIVFANEKELLRRHGHEVVEFVEDNRRINAMNRLSLAVNTIWSERARRKLADLLRRTRPAVAHFHNTFVLVSPSAYYACQRAGVPVVQRLPNYRLLCPAAAFLRDGQVCEKCLGKSVPCPGVVHACYRGSRAATGMVAAMLAVHRTLRTWARMVGVYIALTEFGRAKFIQGGLPADKIAVKPNFVYPDPGPSERRGGYVLFVGRLSPEKGVSTMLAAWERLGKQVPLRVVGDGPLAGMIASTAPPLEGVEWLGWQSKERVLALMKNALALIFPSVWYEGFPMTIAESFACGLPVIASRLGAMAEIVGDRHTGLLFDPGDPDGLAAEVAWLWSHPKEAERMGREARAEFEAKYTAERNYQMLMEVYAAAIAHARGRGT